MSVKNTRAKGYQAENRFRKDMEEAWWRGKVERVGMSGGLRGLEGDILLHQDGDTEKPYYQGETKKGRQVTIKKLLGWLNEQNNDFLVLEPHNSTEQYVFMPVKILKQMVGEW